MRRRRAFTLVEMIAAIVVIAVSVPPMVVALRTAQLSRVLPTKTSTARWLAVQRIEEIVADRHSTTRGYTYCIDANYPDESPVASEPAYTRTVQIVETDADLVTPGTGYKVVTVTVTWTTRRGPASLDVATVMTEYTP